MARQAVLFDDEGTVKMSGKLYAKIVQHPLCLKKRGSIDGLNQIKMKAAFHVGCGEPYGILCRRFEGWYIKAIMAYLKQSGINAEYEKMHEKGLGFTGYLIKRK